MNVGTNNYQLRIVFLKSFKELLKNLVRFPTRKLFIFISDLDDCFSEWFCFFVMADCGIVILFLTFWMFFSNLIGIIFG